MTITPVTTGVDIKNESLIPGEIARIRGTIVYSHITSIIEGEELERRNQEKQRLGMYTAQAPYVTITISNARLEPLDPQKPSLLERYIESKKFYRSQKHPDRGVSFSMDAATRLPTPTYIPNPDVAGALMTDTSGEELAAGNEVTLVVSVYASRHSLKRGLSLDCVLVHGEPQYFRGATDDLLRQLGFTVVEPSPAPGTQKASSAQQEAAAVSEDRSVTGGADGGVSSPVPPVPPMIAGTIPAPQQTMQAPVAQAPQQPATPTGGVDAVAQMSPEVMRQMLTQLLATQATQPGNDTPNTQSDDPWQLAQQPAPQVADPNNPWGPAQG